MISKENHIHNHYLVKRAAVKIFNTLKQQYDFVNFSEFSKFNLSDSLFIGIQKNEIIISCFISKREAYEFSILKAGEDKYKSTSIGSLFMSKFPPLSNVPSEELKKMKTMYEKPYSYEYYYENMLREINILKRHFPDILIQGKMR